MRRVIKAACVAILILCVACSDDPVNREVDLPFVIAQAGSHVVSVSGTKVVFDYDVLVYDESGVVDQSRLELFEGQLSFSNTGKVDFAVTNIQKMDAEPLGCYSTGVLMERNGTERPDRPDQLVRYIFKNTPTCSNYLLSAYPDRNASFTATDPYKLYDQSFINDGNKYDQALAEISYSNNLLFVENRGETNSQFTALDALTKFVATKSANENKNILVVYQNDNDRSTAISENVLAYAVANNVRINGVKNSYSLDDQLMRMSYATGGLFFAMDDYDPFHKPARSDYYALALHADKFLSGNYSFYRVRYELTANQQYFYSGMELRVSLDLLIDNDERLTPVYVPIP